MIAQPGAPLRGVTASVVSHGQMHLVRLLLQDLQALNPPLLSKVVLTLNQPGEALGTLPAGPVQVTVLRNSASRGFGANHNAAFAHCDSDFFAVLNPDLRLPADPFAALVPACGPQDGVVVPTVLDEQGRPADFARRLLTPAELMRRYGLRSRAAVLGAEVHWVAGVFMLFPRAVYAALGGFDERYFMYCEDMDLCARLRLRGYAIRIVDAVSVSHAAQRSSRRRLRPMAWHVRSLLRWWVSPVFRQYRARVAGPSTPGR